MLRLDLYGHCYSDRSDALYGIELFSEQIKELVDALNITQPFHFVGLSIKLVKKTTIKYENYYDRNIKSHNKY